MKLSPEQVKNFQDICRDPISWSQTFIKLPGDSDYFKPNYVQRKILNAPTRKVIICCHRRSGKTYSLIIKALYNIFTRARCQVLLVAPGEKQLSRFFMELDDILGANPELAKDVIKTNAKPPFRQFANGSFLAGFIASKGGDSLRGQSGDLILIDEADFIPEDQWKVILPIIRGDKYRKKPELYAVSTPNLDPKSRFLRMLNQDSSDIIEEDETTSEVTPVFLPITENPEWSEEEIAQIRKEYEPDRMAEFEQEYLCLPVSVYDKNVFKKYQIQRAAELPPQINTNVPSEESKNHINGYARNIKYVPGKVEGEIRTCGMDWDRVQAGPSILVLSYIPGIPKYRVIYREEVDKNKEFVYEFAAHRVIEIHKHLKLDHLFLESTRDTSPSQRVQILAKQECPELFPRIDLVDFNENHVSIDLFTKEQIKRRVKNVLIKNMQSVFENEQISFPKDDKILNEQLSTYIIVGYTERGEKYSSNNEHFVDALGLALWAIFKHYKNPQLAPVASKIISVPRVENAEYQALNREKITGENPFRGMKKFRQGAWGNKPLRKKI